MLIIALALLAGVIVSKTIQLIGRREAENKVDVQQLHEEIQNLNKKLEEEKKRADARVQQRLAQSFLAKPVQSTITKRTLPDSNACVVAMKQVFPESQWATAKAVIMAESGGRTNAVSSTNDHGCFQLHNWPLYDPVANAKGAYSKFSRYGWTPWTVFTSGKYLNYL